MTDDTPDVAPLGVKLAGVLVGLTFVVTDLRGIFTLERAGGDVLATATGQVGIATVLLALLYMAVLLGVVSLDWWGWWLAMLVPVPNAALAVLSPLGLVWTAATVALVLPVTLYLFLVRDVYGVDVLAEVDVAAAVGG